MQLSSSLVHCFPWQETDLDAFKSVGLCPITHSNVTVDPSGKLWVERSSAFKMTFLDGKEGCSHCAVEKQNICFTITWCSTILIIIIIIIVVSTTSPPFYYYIWLKNELVVNINLYDKKIITSFVWLKDMQLKLSLNAWMGSAHLSVITIFTFLMCCCSCSYFIIHPPLF